MLPMTPAAYRALTPEKKSKYSNVKGEADGHSFDSLKEKKRYGQLKMMERAGLITELELQVVYPLVVNGVKICSYVGDFRYMRDGKFTIEDVKSDISRRNRAYRIKCKLMKAIYSITILET